MTLTVDWARLQNNVWHSLMHVNVKDKSIHAMEGVYIVWHLGKNPSVLAIGHGRIRDRLIAHQMSPAVQQHQRQGLYATWAEVSDEHRDGVVRYLDRLLSPKIECVTPECDEVKVNLPWEHAPSNG